jgi:hypothetical protein
MNTGQATESVRPLVLTYKQVPELLWKALAVSFAAVLLGHLNPARAAQLCDRQITKIESFQEEIQKESDIEQVRDDALYVSLADRNDQIVWNFTKPANPAHPAVVCRRIVRADETVSIETSSVCGGPQPACDRMMRDFRQLDEMLKQNMQDQTADPATTQ